MGPSFGKFGWSKMSAYSILKYFSQLQNCQNQSYVSSHSICPSRCDQKSEALYSQNLVQVVKVIQRNNFQPRTTMKIELQRASCLSQGCPYLFVVSVFSSHSVSFGVVSFLHNVCVSTPSESYSCPPSFVSICNFCVSCGFSILSKQ